MRTFGCWTISLVSAATLRPNRFLQNAKISNRLETVIFNGSTDPAFSVPTCNSAAPFCPVVDKAVLVRCCWFGFHRRQCQIRLLPGDSRQRRGMGL
jgi:hypothetical protein